MGMAALGGLFAYLFGGWSTGLILLCFFIVFDYISGMMAASVNGQLSSKKGFAGVSKKILIFVFVAIANLLDQFLGLAFIMQATIFFYLSSEFISITENASVLGVPIPEVIINAMANLPKEQKRANQIMHKNMYKEPPVDTFPTFNNKNLNKPNDQDGGGSVGQ